MRTEVVNVFFDEASELREDVIHLLLSYHPVLRKFSQPPLRVFDVHALVLHRNEYGFYRRVGAVKWNNPPGVLEH